MPCPECEFPDGNGKNLPFAGWWEAIETLVYKDCVRGQ